MRSCSGHRSKASQVRANTGVSVLDAKDVSLHPKRLNGSVDGGTGHCTPQAVRGDVQPASSEDLADEVERALLHAQDLIDSTMSLHRSRPEHAPSLVRADDADAGATIERLLNRAKKTVSASIPGDDEESLEVFAALTGHLPRATAARKKSARPITAPNYLNLAPKRQTSVRLLCGPETLRGGVPSTTQLREARCEIRVARDGPGEALIVDGHLALLKAGPELPESIAIIKDAASVHALDMLFLSLWSTALPLEKHLRLNRSLCTPQAQRVLERLRAGQTDDVAARVLNVSLRTYRRQVAEVMRELGVSSRFQAGVRAVELGLLSRQPASPPTQGDHSYREII